MLPDVDGAELEKKIAAEVRSWDDDFADEAVRQLGEERARAVLAMISGEQIPQTYKTDVPAGAAADDLRRILELRESGRSIEFDLWESAGYVGGVPIEEDQAEDRPGRGRRPAGSSGCGGCRSTAPAPRSR